MLFYQNIFVLLFQVLSSAFHTIVAGINRDPGAVFLFVGLIEHRRCEISREETV